LKLAKLASVDEKAMKQVQFDVPTFIFPVMYALY
jgi:hypothetical protein